ncbi:serine-rich 25 kDa antigen protein-like [Palaemon carinicauda]|uniref:serine-rich 25 kDa antigen protein-like n=1 Tax=Palaemon carinicauda TaxID=392227 RepID=UPI0035B67F80
MSSPNPSPRRKGQYEASRPTKRRWNCNEQSRSHSPGSSSHEPCPSEEDLDNVPVKRMKPRDESQERPAKDPSPSTSATRQPSLSEPQDPAAVAKSFMTDDYSSRRKDASFSQRKDASFSRRQDASAYRLKDSSSARRQDASGSRRQDDTSARSQDASSCRGQAAYSPLLQDASYDFPLSDSGEPSTRTKAVGEVGQDLDDVSEDEDKPEDVAGDYKVLSRSLLELSQMGRSFNLLLLVLLNHSLAGRRPRNSRPSSR